MSPPDALPEPPGFFRVLFLLVRLSFRRTLNQLASGLNRAGRKKAATGERATGPRQATGRRKRAGWFWLIVIGVLFQLNGVQISGGWLQRVAMQLGLETAPETDRYVVDERRYARWLEEDHEAFRAAEALGEIGARDRDEARLRAFRLFQRMLGPMAASLSETERAIHHDRMERLWRTGKMDWVVAVSDFPVPPSLFELPGVGEALARGVAWLLLYLVICLTFIDLGMKNTDLGQVEGDLVWLYTFPVPNWTLFAARLFQYTIATIFGWFVFLPLLFTCAWTRHGLVVSLILATAGTLFLNLAIACARFVAETWLRQRCPLHFLKNLQGLFTLVGVLALFAQLYLLNQGMPREAVTWLAAPAAVDPLWLPSGLPLVLALRPDAALAAGAWMVLGAGLLVPATLALLARLVRRGLLRQAGAYRGVRVPGKAVVTKVTGILSKERRLLLRDRNLLVQTVILPALLLLLQFSFVEDLLTILTKVPSRLAAAAFSLGTYGLASSATASLAIEQRALWLLFTLPVPIERILIRKAIFWGAVASILTAGLLGLGLWHGGVPDLEGLVDFALAEIGILLFALIGTCLGALGTDPFEPELRLRLDPAKVKIFMYLMASHAAILLLQPIAAKVAMTLLLGAFAYALLQDLRREIPYLLEPVDGPPPIITLSDGIYCVLGFFVSQQLIALFLLQVLEIENPGLILNGSFGLSGFLVYALSRTAFWRRGVQTSPTFWPRGDAGAWREIPVGIFYGLSAGLLAIGYMIALMHTHPVLWVESQKTMLDPGSPWFLVLAIVAAPLFEEYIFRGLVLTGLEASASPRAAALGSAMLFALVHPTVSFFPVLALGVATALVYQRTRSLAAAMLAHAIYTALVVTMQAGLI